MPLNDFLQAIKEPEEKTGLSAFLTNIGVPAPEPIPTLIPAEEPPEKPPEVEPFFVRFAREHNLPIPDVPEDLPKEEKEEDSFIKNVLANSLDTFRNTMTGVLISKTVGALEKEKFELDLKNEDALNTLESFGFNVSGLREIRDPQSLQGKIQKFISTTKKSKSKFKRISAQLVGDVIGLTPDFVAVGKVLSGLKLIQVGKPLTEATITATLVGFGQTPEEQAEGILRNLADRGINAAFFGLTTATLGTLFRDIFRGVKFVKGLREDKVLKSPLSSQAIKNKQVEILQSRLKGVNKNLSKKRRQVGQVRLDLLKGFPTEIQANRAKINLQRLESEFSKLGEDANKIRTGLVEKLKSDIVPEAGPKGKDFEPTIKEASEINKSREKVNVANETIGQMESGFIDNVPEEIIKQETLKLKKFRSKSFKEFSRDVRAGLKQPETVVSRRQQLRKPKELDVVTKQIIKTPKEKQESVKFLDKEVEARFQAAGETSLTESRVIVAARSIKDTFRKFKEVDIEIPSKKFPVENNIMRFMRGLNNEGDAMALDFLNDVAAGMDIAGNDLFRKIIILKDIQKEILKPDFFKKVVLGKKKFNFGFKSKDQLDSELRRLEKLLDDPDFSYIKDRLKQRDDYAIKLRDEMVDLGILPEAVKKYKDYYHRQILSYMATEAQYGGLRKGVGRFAAKKGFQRKRIGSLSDYNTNYFQAEFEWVSDAVAKIRQARLLRELNVQTNLEPTLSQRARLQVFAENKELITSIKKKHGKKFRSSEEWKTKIKPKIQERTKLLREPLVKQGYVDWNPDNSLNLRRAFTLEERLMEQVQKESGWINVNEFRKALIVSKKGKDWFIRRELAAALDKDIIRQYSDPAASFVRGTLRGWKAWTLINPSRVVKYNLNNSSGDFDIAFTVDPGILKFGFQSAKDLFDFKRLLGIRKPKGIKEKIAAIPLPLPAKVGKITLRPTRAKLLREARFKKLTPEMKEALELRVVDSGFVGADLGKIGEQGYNSLIDARDPTLIKQVFNFPGQWWEKSVAWTNWRENVLRLSAWRRAKEQLAKGKKIYWTSKKWEIDAITEKTAGKNWRNIKAAKLAREAIGDYGNISQAGRWLREHSIPFYSFMEINFGRYLRLFKNLKEEGRSGAGIASRATLIAGKQLATKTAALAIRMNFYYAAIQIYNNTFFPDLERKMFDQKRQLHLIWGENPDGTIAGIRMQGSFSDFLNWFALEDFIFDIGDLFNKRSTVGDKVIDAMWATGSKIVNSIRPLVKLPVELLTGLSFFPSINNPRPIRDKLDHVAKTLSVSGPFRTFTGRFTRGWKNEMSRVLFQTSNPGENAYYSIMKKKFDFLDKQGEELRITTIGKQANALFYFKQAMKWEQFDQAENMLVEFLAQGGNPKRVAEMKKNLSPLANFKNNTVKAEFFRTLSKEDIEALKEAQRWINETFTLDKLGLEDRLPSIRKKLEKRMKELEKSKR